MDESISLNGTRVSGFAIGDGRLGDTDNIGGVGALVFLYGPPVVGASIGALIGGPDHRFLGGGVGFVAGVAATLIGAKAISASQPPVKGP